MNIHWQLELLTSCLDGLAVHNIRKIFFFFSSFSFLFLSFSFSLSFPFIVTAIKINTPIWDNFQALRNHGLTALTADAGVSSCVFHLHKVLSRALRSQKMCWDPVLETSPQSQFFCTLSHWQFSPDTFKFKKKPSGPQRKGERGG